MSNTQIVNIRSTPVTVPLEAPLIHAIGAHWGRFVRTIIEVETTDGYIGLGEMGGGGEAADLAFAHLLGYLRGHDVFQLEELRFKICNPTASLYNNRIQLHAAIEFACLDIIGQKLGIPVYEFLGGKLQDTVPFASYLFFRDANPTTGQGEVRTVEQLVEHARVLKQEHGFNVHKLKGGVYSPEYELACYRALSDAFPEDRLRYDPNCALSLQEAIEFGRGIAGLRNDYYEDPTWGIEGIARLKQFISIPVATKTAVVNFEQLAANVRQPAVDVILLDTTFWGGIRPCVKAAAVCESFGLGVAVHSSGELGIQLATMLHLGVVLPNLSYAADAHYHHLKDDVIEGGKMTYHKGRIAVPTGPGLGVRLDRERLRMYHELYCELKSYPYDRDPGRPEWFAQVPNRTWRDPASSSVFRDPSAKAIG
jgi:glucarate dehydratase